jgi:hypothetical chaperone protein
MDFGTTNSGIAVYDGSAINVVKLDPLATGNVMRSVIYLTREHQVYVGNEAIQQYNAQNINRERRMVTRNVGRIEMEFAEIGKVGTNVHIEVDDLEPGRLMRSMKSALATPFTSTMIYGREYRLESLIALYLRACRERAGAVLGAPITEVVLGRPVHFVGANSPDEDLRAESRLRVAAQEAGFQEASFEFEPVAAALSYAQKIDHEETILVYDFGGGTLDLTVMTIAPRQRPLIRAIGGVGIAGDRFDERIVEQALLPHFGSTVTWGDKALPVPRSLVEQITQWEGLPRLATLETRAFLHQMQARCSAPSRLYALESLIFNFYGFSLFEAVEQAKRRLSSATFDEIRFQGTEIDIWQLLTRAQFDRFATSEWRKIKEAVLDTVARSGLQPEQIDKVVRTGGSSSIPYGLNVLTGLFGEDKLVTEDLFTGVTQGLAIRAES